MELTAWAAWRWAGTQAHFLRTASPDRVVAGLPPADPAEWTPAGVSDSTVAADSSPEWLGGAFAGGRSAPALVRLGPCADGWPLVRAALSRGRALLLVPTLDWAARLAGQLRSAGVRTALMPRVRRCGRHVAGSMQSWSSTSTTRPTSPKQRLPGMPVMWQSSVPAATVRIACWSDRCPLLTPCFLPGSQHPILKRRSSRRRGPQHAVLGHKYRLPIAATMIQQRGSGAAKPSPRCCALSTASYAY